MNLLFYFPFLFIAIMWLARTKDEFFILHITALFYKVGFSFICLYFVINRYEYGDLHLYFDYAQLPEPEKLLRPDPTYLVAHLNALFLLIFPDSLYGLALLSGLSAFFFSLFMCKIISNLQLDYRQKFYWFSLLYFAPQLSWQQGYIGKETYVLPLLGYLTLRLFQSKTLDAYSMVMLGVCFLIRPYVGVLFGLAVLPQIRSVRSFTALLPLILIVIVCLGYYYYDYIYSIINKIINSGFGEFINITYGGGAFYLERPPSILQPLQLFRPFPWEARNLLDVIASIENTIFLCIFMVIIFDVLSVIFRKAKFDKLYFSVICYCSLFIGIFSFSENMGDLSRRHIYVYPFLVLALLWKRNLNQSNTRA